MTPDAKTVTVIALPDRSRRCPCVVSKSFIDVEWPRRIGALRLRFKRSSGELVGLPPFSDDAQYALAPNWRQEIGEQAATEAKEPT